MRLAVHAGTLRGFGSGIVGRGILEALREADGVDAILALVPADWPADWPPPTEAAQAPLEHHRLPTGVRAKFLGENITLRRRLRTWRADALLSLTDTSLLASPVPHVLLVQQAFLAYPRRDLGFAVPPVTDLRLRAMSAYLRQGLRSVDQFTVQTQHMKVALCARWGLRADRVTVVPSTVQGAARRLFEAGPVTPDEPPTLAYVSGPGPHKNHEVLAPMMASLALDRPGVRCLVTVEADQVPRLVDAATRLAVLDRFEFAGHLTADAAMARLQQAAVAVLPSRLESFGIPYHEALALGVPAVAVDAPFAREALGQTGHYADATDGEGWAHAVRHALDTRAETSQAARARFAAQAWPWPKIAAAYVSLVEDVIGRR